MAVARGPNMKPVVEGLDRIEDLLDRRLPAAPTADEQRIQGLQQQQVSEELTAIRRLLLVLVLRDLPEPLRGQVGRDYTEALGEAVEQALGAAWWAEEVRSILNPTDE